MKGRRPNQIAAGSHVLTEVPKPPSWLSREAKIEWKRVAPVLVERAVLTSADLAALEGYTVAVGLVRECQAILNRDGPLVVNKSGEQKRHPAATMQDAALKTARLFAAEFGLTPVARSRTHLQGGAPDDGEDLSPLDF